MHIFFFAEYNVLQPSPLNEKVLREKRKKLKETFDRVMRLYVSILSEIHLSNIMFCNKTYRSYLAQR